MSDMRVAIVGGGMVAAAAAAAIARALPMATVLLLRTPVPAAALADRLEATLPGVERLFARIGIDERMLVTRAGAGHRLATRYVNWSSQDRDWWLAHGEHGDGPDFAHQWWRSASTAKAIDAASAAAALAAANRFARRGDLDHPLRLEPGPTRDLLLALASRAGVAIRDAAAIAVEPGPAGIAALNCDGARIDADLLVDAGGPAAPLLGSIAPAFETWGHRLPVDRLLCARDQPPVEPLLADRMTGVAIGWLSRVPGRGALRQRLAYAGAVADDDRAARLLRLDADAEPAETIAIAPGRRPAPWHGNVVAIGDAAVALDPLGHLNFALAGSAILRLLDLWPGPQTTPLLADEYNRRTRDETEAAADFVALHYAGGRARGAFWEATRALRRSPTLERLLAHHDERGRLPPREEDPLHKENWLAVLDGIGRRPRRPDPRALSATPADGRARIDRAVTAAQAAADRAPPYPQALAAMLRAS